MDKIAKPEAPSGETVMQVADRIDKMLEEVGAGNLYASPVQRAFLAGAVYGLKLATGEIREPGPNS